MSCFIVFFPLYENNNKKYRKKNKQNNKETTIYICYLLVNIPKLK